MKITSCVPNSPSEIARVGFVRERRSRVMKGFIKRLLKVLLYIIGIILTIIYWLVWSLGGVVVLVIELTVYLFFNKDIIFWYIEKGELTMDLICKIEDKIDSL